MKKKGRLSELLSYKWAHFFHIHETREEEFQLDYIDGICL